MLNTFYQIKVSNICHYKAKEAKLDSKIFDLLKDFFDN